MLSRYHKRRVSVDRPMSTGSSLVGCVSLKRSSSLLRVLVRRAAPFVPSLPLVSSPSAWRLEQLANRVAPCKDAEHGHLLEGTQDQGGRGGRAGDPQEGRRQDLPHLPHHPKTLAEEKEGRRGPLAGHLHGTKAAHPSHSRGEASFGGAARSQRRCHPGAPLRAMGRA